MATKNYLRGETGNAEELAGILSPNECAELFRAPVQPIFCLDVLRCVAVDWADWATRHPAPGDVGSGAPRSPWQQLRLKRRPRPPPEVVAQGLSALTRTLDGLCGTFGGMERINNTPLPFVYVSHLRTFLLLYLVAVPLVFAEVWGWATVAVTPLVAFALIGIEVAAVDCERPMAHRANHMPMDRFCIVVADNAVQTLRAARSPCVVEATNGRRATLPQESS